MSRLECISVEAVRGDGLHGDDGANAGGSVEVVLMEPRPFRPFKTSEEYLIAMREDLAEWLHRLYSPQLDIDYYNFMDLLEDGVALCKHANNVRRTAVAYKEKLEQQGSHRRRKSFSTHTNIPDRDVLYRPDVKPKSFFARDNVHNFIQWCRLLGIYECLLFETDDLVLRKNEKSFILCLLEVARRGAHFGMPAPMLVQFEKEIDREMAKENQLGKGDGCQEDDDDDGELVEHGPMAQIVTNDLRSLDEMVRDLVETCSCPTQFPMIRISEGKYRIGDTKMLIFVRVLRNHVMVRVGGGWDTLSHYLEKHDPCRCRAGHRATITSKLSVSQNSRGNTQMAVSYERAASPPPGSRRSSGASVTGASPSSRKNSITGLPTVPVGASPHERLRGRQRSPSPSPRMTVRQRSQSPAGPRSPVAFQRTGSGRYSSGSPYHFANHHQQQQQAELAQHNVYSPPQNNLDSLESYDSGVGLGLGSPGGQRRSSGAKPQQQTRRSISSGEPTSTVGRRDSTSEMSDDGYRTGGVVAVNGNGNKNEEPEERPDSSCTQVSQSSSTESGVSSVDGGVSRSKNQATPGDKTSLQNAKTSKIPFLGSLRGLGKISSQQQQRRDRKDSNGSESFSRPISRSNSITSESSNSAPTSFHRDAFGRHSLRSRGETDRVRPTRTSNSSTTSPSHQPANGTTQSRYLLSWSGRNRRERPALSAQLFTNPNTPVNNAATTPSNGTGQHRSRSINSNGAPRSQPRAASTSPSSRRRYFGTSVNSNPTSPEINLSPPYWRQSSANKQQHSTPVKPAAKLAPVESSKMSPLLRNMLNDVEIDNDASILKKMEEIVNQYKARVEGILAAEGKTLGDEWTTDELPTTKQSPTPLVIDDFYNDYENDVRSGRPLNRRNSLDSSLAHHNPAARVYPTPRKDTASPSPSKIPMPLFYRSKETCL